MSEVKVFMADDFENGMMDIANTSKHYAEFCNSLLESRLVKYYAKDQNSSLEGTWDFRIRASKEGPGDTHIIYGLEPQPIVRDTVKLKIHIYRDENGNFASEIADEQVRVMGGYKYVDTVSVQLKDCHDLPKR